MLRIVGEGDRRIDRGKREAVFLQCRQQALPCIENIAGNRRIAAVERERVTVPIRHLAIYGDRAKTIKRTLLHPDGDSHTCSARDVFQPCGQSGIG